MKAKLLMPLAIMLMGVSLSVQASGPDKEKKERVFPSEQMIKELNLSEKQIADLKKADGEFKSKMQSLRDKNKAERKEMKESMKQMKDDRRDILKKNLTKDQYITYLEKQVDRLQKMNFKKGMPRGPRGQFGPQRHQGKPAGENIPEPVQQ
jgi:hypothetical protein